MFIPFMRFLQCSLVSSNFLVLLGCSFYIFLSSPLDVVHFQYPQSLLFSKRSDIFLIWQFDSFGHLPFSTFHY